MPARTGNCQICGDEFIRVNKVRKYCIVCQGIRDVTYAPKRSVNCAVCGAQFWPLKANYSVCNPCREPMESPEKYDACRKCEKHLRPAPGLTAYCMSCVQSSEAMRRGWLTKVVEIRDIKTAGDDLVLT